MEGGLQGGMAPSERVHAEAREEVEIALTLGVEQVRTLAPHVETIEPDRLEDPTELVVQVLLVERIVLTMPGAEQLGNVERHTSPHAGRGGEAPTLMPGASPITASTR